MMILIDLTLNPTIPRARTPVAQGDPPSRSIRTGNQAIFRANVILSIPNVALVPALEEAQQALNRAVDCVVSANKGVGQWSKERISKVSAEAHPLLEAGGRGYPGAWPLPLTTG